MTTTKKREWKCPKCGALADKHGKGGEAKCATSIRSMGCSGFLCECSDEDGKDHGLTTKDRCYNARCYHCDWQGVFPPVRTTEAPPPTRTRKASSSDDDKRQKAALKIATKALADIVALLGDECP